MEVLQKTSERQTLEPNFAKMNQPVQGDSSCAPAILPLKRRRGRPRKDPSLKRVVRAQAPPRFELVQEIQPQQVNKNDATDGMIGQAVTGVVESAFDAGYLVSVRIGDSNTNYRGVVFKPGHFVPVTTANDVAPHVQMIIRNEVRPSAQNQLQAYGHRAERNGSLNVGSRSSKGKQVVIHPSVPPVGARGTVVPVVLQPVNLTNGQASSQNPASQASLGESSREREVQMVKPLAMLPPDGPVTPGQLPPEPTRETVPLQTQVSNKVAIGAGQKEDGFLSKGAEVVQREEVKPVVSTNVTIPVAVTKVSQGSGLSPKKDAGKNEASHQLSAEPVNPPLHTQATSVSKPLMNYGTGRMTELLQAVQENLMENQLLRAGESGLGVMKSPKTDSSKEETSVQ
ncbi:protein METABOLIC NETWORK MODULATOR 1-like isoform X1 [Lycium barbarum]|uniref:protein METABOLIC NETWORK MODULATOR 1-like isoform X1 n=2 Tax=Lycium barbarum TaxID=112863 RepID=UPI00293EDD22|nr:protein METABOLIC NETWORK MODULATOR 1-like isoform X1 [Lycium barbarum]